jgi:hypothetical protein
MLEIVNQLDGFDSRGNIKVWIHAFWQFFHTDPVWRNISLLGDPFLPTMIERERERERE